MLLMIDNHAAYLPARRDMMQVWAEYLDAIEVEALAEAEALTVPD